MDDPIGSHYEKIRQPSWNVNILRHEPARGDDDRPAFWTWGWTAATSTMRGNPLWLLDGLVVGSLGRQATTDASKPAAQAWRWGLPNRKSRSQSGNTRDIPALPEAPVIPPVTRCLL